jgi:hypothetical protein
MSTTEIFRKHFGDTYGTVGLWRPEVEAFFTELNEECLREDAAKKLNRTPNDAVSDTTEADSNSTVK